MQKIISMFLLLLLTISPSYAWSWGEWNSDEKAVERLLKSQVRYANCANFDKFIKTYDENYVNTDGFNLKTYSSLVKDIWNTYDNIKYSIEIEDIKISGNKAEVKLKEKSFAEIEMTDVYSGFLNAESDSIYHLKKGDKGWKVISDYIIDETTTMLYGNAQNLDIKLSVPNKIEANKEYCATLEFVPPDETFAIASIASDIVEYPQKPTEEVFRALPEDNILERLFTSNDKKTNEYVVASIGLTKTAICDLSVKLSLTGFGYVIKRVNVLNSNSGDENE